MPVTQPLILVDEVESLGEAGRSPSADVAACRAARRRRWWSVAAWTGALIVGLTAVAAFHDAQPAPSPAVDRAIRLETPGGWTDVANLVIRAAPPDEVVTLLSAPGHGFCGQLELRLDGISVQPRLLVETGSGLLVTFGLPAATPPGPHKVALIAGTPAPKATGACRESVRHRRIIVSGAVHV